MLNIEVLCVGKVNADYFAAGCAEFAKRAGGLANLRVTELPEEPIREKNPGEATIRKALEKEGEAMLAKLRKGTRVVALCIEGKQLSSEELADWMQSCAVTGSGDFTFIIGSSHGIAPGVKQRAELKLSMSKMTFPHQLARLMLLEQIYRALSILAGSKYHK